MKKHILLALVAIFVFCVININAQQHEEAAPAAVKDGGVKVAGWTGEIDAKEKAAGMTLNSARLAQDGKALHVTTGPATTYWNPKNTASGDYTVSATFTESKYMGLNDHPHPYGIMIAGNDLGTENASYLYCAAYGNGTFIVRGMGPKPFKVNDRPQADTAVNKAAGVGQPVTQTIAMTVKGNIVTCSINNKVVGTYDKAALVAPGKLKSTDGVYGIRFAHNTDATVTDFKKGKAQ